MRLACLPFAFLVTALGWATPGGGAAALPNIVVILVDDMVFSDLGCYVGQIPTTRIDALAAGGLRFSQFYNTGRCYPSRASLLMGLYSHQAGVGHMVDDSSLPGYRGRLGDSCVTIAEAVRAAGYHTSIAGKWHVGQNHGVAPWNRGFDRSLDPAKGGYYQAGSPRYDLALDGKAIAAGDPRLSPNWYTTDLWTTFGQEGKSLVPVFAGALIAREALYWEHEGNAAVRAGDLKLVRLGAKGPWELYDLEADRTEAHDLAATRPADAARLAGMWQAWAERVNAVPRPENKRSRPEQPRATAIDRPQAVAAVTTEAPASRPRSVRPESRAQAVRHGTRGREQRHAGRPPSGGRGSRSLRAKKPSRG